MTATPGITEFRDAAAGPWPTPVQRLLIRAAILDDEEAKAAWHAWQARQDLKDLDPASFSVLPLLYRNLERNAVHDPRWGRLRGVYKLTWSKNQLALRAAQGAARHLQRAGVPVLSSRGLPLLLGQSGDTGTRLLTDTDLTVRAADLEQAVQVLLKEGWRSERPPPEAKLRPYLHRLGLRHASGGPELELRWRLLGAHYPPEVDDLIWRNSAPSPVDELPVLFPDPTDLLLLTLFHAHRSGEQDACRWVIDALALLRTGPSVINHSELPSRARALGVWEPVRDGLNFLHAAFGCPLPSELLEELARATPAPDGQLGSLERGPSQIPTTLRAVLAERWQLYARVTRHTGSRPGLAGFADFVLRFYRHCWSLESRAQVPVAGLGRWRALRRRRR